MAKLCGLLVLAWMVVGVPGVVWAQGAAGLISSWEGTMDGWAVNSGNGKTMARGAGYSEIGVTDGKKSLALQMIGGYRPALVRKWDQTGGQFRGRKLSIAVMAPQGALTSGMIQLAVAFNAAGAEFKDVPLQVVPQDGKTH